MVDPIIGYLKSEVSVMVSSNENIYILHITPSILYTKVMNSYNVQWYNILLSWYILYTEWFTTFFSSKHFFYLIFQVPILKENFFKFSSFFYYYSKNVFWRYKLLYFKCLPSPFPLFNYKFYSWWFFWKCWHIKFKI